VCRNRKDAHFTPVFRYFLPPGRPRHVVAPSQFVTYLFEESLYTLFLDVVEGYPVDSRSSVVLLGQRVRHAQCFHLADMHVQSPEPPRRFSLRLDVYSPPQVLQINGRIYQLVLAFLMVGDVTNSRAPLLHGRYSASSLLRAQPPPSRLRSISRLSRLYDLPCSADFSAGRGGLLQLLGMSLSPCCRIPPRRGEVAASFRFRLPMLPSPHRCGLGPRIHSFSRPHSRSLSLRPGDS